MTSGSPEALVTDTHDRAALAGLRGLGRAGIRTMALAPDRMGAGMWSRYANARLRGPDPTRDPGRFAQRVQEILERHGPCVVYPGREEAIDSLLGPAAPTSLAALMPYPSLDGLAAIRDKRRLPELAASVGLAAPETVFEGALENLRDAESELPMVVKSVVPKGIPAGPRLIRTREELDELTGEGSGQEQVLAQRPDPGSLAAIALVLDRNGQVAAVFQQRTSRTWPPTMGVSAVASSVAPDLDLCERLAAMLRAVGFGGLAQVQFLESPGGPVVIDVNPRFYGSLSLAIAAGVNLPAIWHRTATGEPTEPVPTYPPGVVYRWFEARLFAFARGSGSGNVPVGRASAGAVWARDDPIASAALVATTVRGALSKRFGRSASS